MVKQRGKQKFIDINEFQLGLQVLEDPTKSSVGSAREMRNCLITDRLGLGKRPGTELLGNANATNDGVHGLFNYKKSNGQEEVMIKTYDDELEYYHDSAGWSRLKSGFSTSQEFSFKEHNVNTENEDYVYFCNAREDYQRWSGNYATVQVAATTTSTTLEVDSVIYPNTFSSGAASSGTDTIVGIATTKWSDDQWIDFYVKTSSNQIRRITDNTASSLTFDALSSAISAGETFSIVKNKFPASGTLMIGGSSNAYSAIPYSSAFTITAPSAGIATGTAVTIMPTEYPANPKGNRMDTLFTRMYVGGVNAGIAYSTADAKQGSYSPGSVYYAKIKNATDFTFTATRVAGEGGIESLAYGAGNITDIACQDQTAYIFKQDYVEALSHEQSSSDSVVREPVSMSLGSVNKAVKGENDIYFATQDNQITSIGRLANKDTRPQALNVGYKVKRLLDTYNMEDFNGIKYENRLLFAMRSSGSDYNDRILVYNERTQGFEGEWTLPAYGFAISSGYLFYGDSTKPNVYQMFEGTSDAQGSDTFGITSTWKSNWINLTPSHANLQSLNALSVEGYITGGTSVTFKIYKDFSETAALENTFTGTEESYLDGDDFVAFLGGEPLGVHPLGAISNPDAEGRRHFHWIIYFPFIYGNHFSLGVDNAGTDQNYEITRMSLGLLEDTEFNLEKVRTV